MVERLQDVVIGGDAAGWWMVVVVKKTKSLFVYDAHMSFRQTPLTRLSILYIKAQWSRLSKICKIS